MVSNVEKLKDEGNAAFRISDFMTARAKYTQVPSDVLVSVSSSLCSSEVIQKQSVPRAKVFVEGLVWAMAGGKLLQMDACACL